MNFDLLHLSVIHFFLNVPSVTVLAKKKKKKKTSKAIQRKVQHVVM